MLKANVQNKKNLLKIKFKYEIYLLKICDALIPNIK